ncbi:MAG: sulfatase-like hydrolase/transferase [bacterium]
MGLHKYFELSRLQIAQYLGIREFPEENYYAAMITHMDNGIGRIMEHLKALGIDENTLVIFTSDNGPTGEMIGHFGSNGPFKMGKESLYEGGIRVPFIARWPNKINSGTVNNQMTALYDFLATGADITGYNMTDIPTDGSSLLPGPLSYTRPFSAQRDQRFMLGHSDWLIYDVSGRRVGNVSELRKKHLRSQRTCSWSQSGSFRAIR